MTVPDTVLEFVAGGRRLQAGDTVPVELECLAPEAWKTAPKQAPQSPAKPAEASS